MTNPVTAILSQSIHHSHICPGLDAIIEAQVDDGVHIIVTHGFYSFTIHLDDPTLERIMRKWPVPDVCDELPF